MRPEHLLIGKTIYQHLHDDHAVWLTRMEAKQVRGGRLNLEELHSLHHQTACNSQAPARQSQGEDA